jgi:riboflavin kinase/FMN adenylyltransferase
MSGTALTIGNFDGVHMGHIALVRRARELVGASGRVVALAFDPHPVSVLRPESAPARLTTFVRRRELLMAAACDEVVQLAPTAHLLGKSPEDFLRSVVDRYRPLYLVEGDDFRFGKARAGDVKTLAALGPSMGFEAVLVPPVEVVLSDHLVVRASSSIVRWLLLHGRVADAARVLGRPYELAGTVVRGDQVGRQLGFPTANLKPDRPLVLAAGVYGARASWEGGAADAVVNVGYRPTFGENQYWVEAFLLDFSGDLYDRTLRIEFLERIRPEMKFSGVDALKAQVMADIEAARARRDRRERSS